MLAKIVHVVPFHNFRYFRSGLIGSNSFTKLKAAKPVLQFDQDEFSEWCRTSTSGATFDDFMDKKSVKGMTFGVMQEVNPDSGEQEKLEVCVLPPDNIFPSMLDDKQVGAISQNVVTKRVQDIDAIRFQRTVDRLRMGLSAAWIGHADQLKRTSC